MFAFILWLEQSLAVPTYRSSDIRRRDSASSWLVARGSWLVAR
ncbi:hypothetical protein [Paraburkholderia sediminicola]